MNKALQALVAVACIVVIACGIWWMLDRREAQAEVDRSVQLATEARSQAQLERCKSDVTAWDDGNREPAERRFGNSASQAIDTCRNLIKIDDLKRSKPSE